MLITRRPDIHRAPIHPLLPKFPPPGLQAMHHIPPPTHTLLQNLTLHTKPPNLFLRNALGLRKGERNVFTSTFNQLK